MSKELIEDDFSRLVRKIDESDEELKDLACKNDTLAMENGKLQERLELYNEVLEDVVKECSDRGLENKKLKEQLEEANAVITSFPAETLSTCMIALEYLKKWSVK